VKPFVWHIYPQHDGVHLQKLRAFMARYCAGLPPEAEQAMRGLWEVWNGGCDTLLAKPADCGSSREVAPPALGGFTGPCRGGGCGTLVPVGQAWNDFQAHQSMLRSRAQGWARKLAANNLALNLLDFFQETSRMRAFKNEGQQT
jgi:hypothetical protein